MKQQEKTQWFLRRQLQWLPTSHQWMRNKSTWPAHTTGKTEEISAAATTTIGGGATLLLPQGVPTTTARTGDKPATATATTTGAKTTMDKAPTEATPTRPMIVSP